MLQLIDLIEKLHSVNLVHNDLKLENIVVGVRDPSQLHLIDFGLTQSLVDVNGKHIQKCYMKNFSGNFMFSSLNSCRGFNKSRRDDIESIFYILIFLLNNQYLPWCDLLNKGSNERPDLRMMLKERLDFKFTRKLFTLIPNGLADCLKKVLTLNFDETPDYTYYR